MGLNASGDPARQAAHAVLVDILGRSLPLETALGTALKSLADSRDRSFAHQLALTVLRRHGALKQVAAQLLERPLPGNLLGAQVLIEMGLAQLFFLNVPDHAAVGSSVALADVLKLRRQKKLINAVLRRAQREREALTTIAESTDAILPDWLKQRWVRQFGAETVGDISETLTTEPPLDITVAGDVGEWAEKLGATPVSGQTLRRPATSVSDLEGYDDGTWWIQDAAAALPARLLPLPESGPVLDLCAAPGGKTAQVAATGAEVIAVDKSARRLRRLRENLGRLNLEVAVVEADASTWRHTALVDAILLDAPCSSTGTIRRRPDIPWSKSEADIASLAGVQAAILDNAVSQLKAGGVLVYAVCSLEDEEGPDQIEAALSRHPELARLPLTEQELGLFSPARMPSGDARILPCHLADLGGVDGFYIARLKRNK